MNREKTNFSFASGNETLETEEKTLHYATLNCLWLPTGMATDGNVQMHKLDKRCALKTLSGTHCSEPVKSRVPSIGFLLTK